MARSRQHVEKTYSPAALANENKQLLTLNPGEFIQDFVVRVLTAGDGSGTLSFGTTSGGTDIATTANVGVTATGYKSAAAAAVVMATAAAGLWANYTVGTATILPVVRISFTLASSGL